jgi:hypothetical protein
MTSIDDLSAHPIKLRLSELDRVKAKGEELITEIRTTTERLFPPHFKASQTGASLQFKFYGTDFLVRVELPINENDIPRVRTYVIAEKAPLKLHSMEMDLEFDDLGNVNKHMTIDEAARKFMRELLKQLTAKNIFLHP